MWFVFIINAKCVSLATCISRFMVCSSPFKVFFDIAARFGVNLLLSLCPAKGDEPEKELPPAVATKKQPPVQENTAAVQPVKTAAVEVRV